MESYFPFPTITIPSPPISDEQFKLFHSIDRKLYNRLIHNLDRDPNESMHIMGFLMWLEQDLVRDLDIISRMLSLSPSVIDEITKEISFCLRQFELEKLQPQDYVRELPSLQNLVRKNLIVKELHDNRLEVRAGVSKLVGEVCVRAFHDILQNAIKKKPANQDEVMIGQTSGK